jgi:hypothetical protein
MAELCWYSKTCENSRNLTYAAVQVCLQTGELAKFKHAAVRFVMFVSAYLFTFQKSDKVERIFWNLC